MQLKSLNRRDNENLKTICKQETINNKYINCTLRLRIYILIAISSLIKLFSLSKARRNNFKKLDSN